MSLNKRNMFNNNSATLEEIMRIICIIIALITLGAYLWEIRQICFVAYYLKIIWKYARFLIALEAAEQAIY